MKFAVIFCCLLVGTLVSADVEQCTRDTKKTVPFPLPDNYQIGCNPYSDNVDYYWRFQPTGDENSGYRFLVTAINTEACCDKINFRGLDLDSVTTSGTVPREEPYFMGPKGGEVYFRSDSGGKPSGPMWAVDVTTYPMHSLATGTTVSSNQNAAGGFIYFYLYNLVFGELAMFTVNINSYQGLSPPKMFVKKNGFPSLESFNYVNNTVNSGGKYTASISVPKPADGSYLVGVYMYGTSVSVDITSRWVYDSVKIPQVANGVLYDGSVSSATVAYQVQIPRGTNSVTIEFSRKEPGGYPSCYVQEGTFPDTDNFLLNLVTDVNNQYFKKVINNPNPSSSDKWNAGTYLLRFFSSSGTSGFYFKVTWN